MGLYASLSELLDAVRFEVRRENNAQFDRAAGRLVAQAEMRMWHGSGDPLKCDPLRLRVMEKTATVTLTDGTGYLPTGYLQTIQVDWPSEPKTGLIYEPPRTFTTNRYRDTSGSPTRFTIQGSSVLVNTHVSGDLTFVYYEQPDALEAMDDTNDVLDAHPLLYFNAALIEAHSHLRNPDEMQKAFGAYLSAAGGVSRSDGKARRSYASPMAPRIPGWRV